jgi:hypothetical protein
MAFLDPPTPREELDDLIDDMLDDLDEAEIIELLEAKITELKAAKADAEAPHAADPG